MKKTILITGCSSGIGYDAAKTLVQRDWRVFATCRKAEDCARLQDEGFESFQLDYRDENSIQAAVNETLKRTGGLLDALFNNGAYAIPGAVEDLPRDALREIFEVNLFGYFDLINKIMPIMRAQGHGRIVNCSSVLGMVALPARGAYNATKFAMEGLTDTMRFECMRLKLPIKIILIEPGPITTQIRQNSIPHFYKWIDWENSPNEKFYRKLLIPRMEDDSGKKDLGELGPEAVTKKLIHALEHKRPHSKYFVTHRTYSANLLRRVLSQRLIDRIIGGSWF